MIKRTTHSTIRLGRYEPGDGRLIAVKVVDISGNEPSGMAAVQRLHMVMKQLAKGPEEAVRLDPPDKQPFVVVPTAVVVSDGVVHITMKYYRDGTLADRLAELAHATYPGIPVAELLGYMRCAAVGLDHLHRCKIPHGDVKPSCFLRFGGGSVAVSDFGFDWPPPPPTDPESVPRTPEYSAPEVWSAPDAARMRTFAADQYALAVTYAELRTGRNPFRLPGEARRQTHARIMQVRPVLAGMTKSEREALRVALRRTPAERYPSCVALVEALERATQTTPTQSAAAAAPPGSPPTPDSDKIVVITHVPVRQIPAWVMFVGIGFVSAAVLLSCAAIVQLMAPTPGTPPANADRVRLAAGVKTDAPDRPGQPAKSTLEEHLLQRDDLPFAGLRWTPKADSRTKPPIQLSSDEKSVRAETDGRLRLSVRRVAGGWVCAEVVSTTDVGYGVYRLQVERGDRQPLGRNDDQAVFTFGLGRYGDDYEQRIAFELSGWGVLNNAKNAHFLVGSHKGERATNLKRFGARSLTRLGIEVDWRADRVAARCWDAARSDATAATVADAEFGGEQMVDVPSADGGDTRIRLGLWLHKGEPPSNGYDQEVMVSNFTYTRRND